MKIKTVLVVLFLAISPRAFGLAVMGSDIFYSGFGYLGHTDVLVRTHTFALIGTESFGIGPVANYTKFRAASEEFAYGVALSAGSEFFVELNGMIYRIDHRGKTGKGYQGGLVIGWKLTKHLRISVPFTYTAINDGDFEDQWKATFVPHIGLRFEI